MIQNILLQYQAKDIKKLEINKASNSKIIYIAKKTIRLRIYIKC